MHKIRNPCGWRRSQKKENILVNFDRKFCELLKKIILVKKQVAVYIEITLIRF